MKARLAGVCMVLMLALAACGSSSVTKTITAAPSVTAAGTSTQQLPYDSEENAFMGSYEPNGDVNTSTGCLALSDNQVACDCAYRALRAQGYPASQLAAVGSGVTISNNLPANAPAWLLHAEAACQFSK